MTSAIRQRLFSLFKDERHDFHSVMEFKFKCQQQFLLLYAHISAAQKVWVPLLAFAPPAVFFLHFHLFSLHLVQFFHHSDLQALN